MTPPEEAKLAVQTTGQDPVYEQALIGTLQITMPLNMERLRYRRVFVGVQSVATWTGQTEKKGASDILFRTENVLKEERPEGWVLEAGER